MTAETDQAADVAARVWRTLSSFVGGQDRRRALRAALNVGPSKVEVLLHLLDGPMTLREIARAVDVDPPAATVGVDQLERRGLVYRTPHPDDKRRKLVHLTDAGRAAARKGQELLDQPPSALAQMDPHDLDQLDTIFTRLRLDQNP